MFSPSDIRQLTSNSIDSNPYCIIKDNLFDDILKDLVRDVTSLKGNLRLAKMSKGENEFADEYIRGDSLCWITPRLCTDMELASLQDFITRIRTACNEMSTELGLRPEFNVQFAMYPGKGEGYNRHRDAHPKSCNSSATTELVEEVSRQLTCVLYLNKDWEPDDGGQLRIFTLPGAVIEGAGEPFSFWVVNGYDIDPLFGR